MTRADARLGEVRSWAPAGLPLNPLPAFVTPRTVPKRRPRPAAFRLETAPFSSGIKMHFKARSQAAPSVRLSLMLQTHAELTPQPRARGTARSSLMKSARSRGSRPLASVTVLPAGRPMQREPRRGLQPQSQHRAAAPPPPLPAGPWPVAVRNTNAEGWNSRLGWGTRLREGATPSSLRRHLTAKWVFNIPSVTQQAVVSVLILDFLKLFQQNSPAEIKTLLP